MRILNILCGAAVLFTTLAYGHIMYHHLTHASTQDFHNPFFLPFACFFGVVGILSLIGAILLLRRRV